MKATLIIIQNETDHAQAKELIQKLVPSDDPDDQARLAAQAQLVEAYERTHWPRRSPSLPDILAYLMDQHSLSRTDLATLLGTPSRVSEVLSGKRELSMTMIKRLRERFHISADLLISPQKPRKRLAA
jgi:HTH-type transcriptional regulator/antitoxin HigA